VVVSLGIKRLPIYGDSSVVINQVNKDWDCTKETLDAYYAKVRKLDKHFQGLELHHVMQDLNIAADVLVKLGLDIAKGSASVFVQELDIPSIKQEASTPTDTPMPDAQVLVINPAWTQVFIDYIRDHKLPDDKVETEQITCRSKNYVLVRDMLY